MEITYNYHYAIYELENDYGHIGMTSKNLEESHNIHQMLDFNITEIKSF